jgi:DNA helicase-2/ATP-dependent DNA helicase PcrA
VGEQASHEKLAQLGMDPILQDLNPSQIEAVTQPLSAITRVVAGPGSGKTRVLTSRIAYLLQQDPTARILGVTFTRKAAGEMQHRLEKLLTETSVAKMGGSSSDQGEIGEEMVGDIDPTPEGLNRVSLGTFHSICAKILRWNGDLLADLPSVQEVMVGSPNATVLDGGFSIADQAEQLRILKECLKERELDLKQSGLREFDVLNAIGQCKSKFAQGENPFQKKPGKQISTAIRVASTIYTLYRAKFLTTNNVDFDDIIYMARELLLENEEVREHLQRRWPHVLVDEFQDTSKAQMDLVKFLTSSSLFIVGDADQSIYSWRGAHVSSLSDFAEEFKGHLGRVETVYLMENYRSTANIVRAAQRVISASSIEASGTDKMRQDMKPKRESGPSPRIMACKDDRAEANFVVKHVKDLVNSGDIGPKNTVAFIYRTNAQSRALEEACVTHNLPYVIFGSATSFYKRQEIKDCLCFFRWLHNGRDRSAMLRCFKTPARGIGDVAVREFDDYCTRVDSYYEEFFPTRSKPTPFEILLSFSEREQMGDQSLPLSSESISTRPLKLLTALSQQLRCLRDLAYEEPVERVLSSIVNNLEILPHLNKISKSTTEFEERKANVRELQQAAQRYTNDGPCLLRDLSSSQEGEEFLQSPLGTFLDDVALVTDMADDAERSTEERFVASLMTIHASKGMEFDTVFVVGNEDGTFPTSQVRSTATFDLRLRSNETDGPHNYSFQALQEGEGSVVLEEERRLCYVAMTRAKTELFLTWRKEVPIFTGEGIRQIARSRSHFLDVLVSKKPKENGSMGRTSQGMPKWQSGVAAMETESKSRPRRKDGYSSKTTYSNTGRWQHKSSKKAHELPVEPKPRKYAGTTSVYDRRQPPLSREPRPATHHPIQALSGNRSSPARQSLTSSSPAPSKSTVPLRPSKSSQAGPVSPGKMDSTWFYPVGSEVEHRQLGHGKVLQPPLSKQTSDVLLVRVKFSNGQERDFPATGSELSLIL